MLQTDLLAIVINDALPEFDRISALGTVIESLPDGHPFRAISLERLFRDRLVPSWSTRLYLVKGRAVERLVSRPAVALSDVLS